MFGNDDQKQAATDGVDQAAAAAADDQGAFAATDDGSDSDVGIVAHEPAVLPAPTADDRAAATPFVTDDAADRGRPSVTPSAPVTPDSDDLLTIKQDALKQLSPLIGHLNQSPEEKFRTTMMMIQAADDQKLIKSAYDAAQSISDEKVRAQALLDIINEINYFTQQHNA